MVLTEPCPLLFHFIHVYMVEEKISSEILLLYCINFLFAQYLLCYLHLLLPSFLPLFLLLPVLLPANNLILFIPFVRRIVLYSYPPYDMDIVLILNTEHFFFIIIQNKFLKNISDVPQGFIWNVIPYTILFDYYG